MFKRLQTVGPRERQQCLESSLFEAVSLREPNSVKDALVSLCKTPDPDREVIVRGFCQAVQQGSTDIVQVFLECGGVSIDEPDPMFEESPLMQAVRYRYSDLVHFLIGNGANINFQCTNEQTTCLHVAVGGRSESDIPVDIVKELVKIPSIQLDLRNRKGKTPLMVAVEYSRPKAVEILIEAGADVNQRYFPPDRLRMGVPLPFLCFGYFNPHVDMQNSTNCLKSILNVTRDPDVQWQGMTLLLTAIHANSILAIKYLISINCNLDLGGGPSIFDLGGLEVTPILEAYVRCNKRVVHLLIDSGCQFQSLRRFVELKNQRGNQNEDEALKSWVVECLSSPRKLVDICRIAIRTRLGPFPADKIEQLKLPSSVADFILLDELL